MWIYNQKEWPAFFYDKGELAAKLADIRYRQGRLLGRMESLGFEFRQEAGLKTLTNDVVNSSAIEGENLNPGEVRSSIARRLGSHTAGLKPSSRDVEGIVEMMLDATQVFYEPLTKERLLDWHAALFPTGRSGMRRITVGDWRTSETGPMQVISGATGREKVHFEAPDASAIKHDMSLFLEWFNSETNDDPVIKAGIAHFWFVTIHPFEDGNGRIARAIGDMALARADNSPDRFYSLSTQIERERKDYYNQLERQQRGNLDITKWLDWFLNCLGRSLSQTEQTLAHVIYKARIWERIRQLSINDRQRIAITRMLDDSFTGYMNTSKYAMIAKCSNDTALRDIQELKQWHIFIQNPGGGRSTSYRLPDVMEY